MLTSASTRVAVLGVLALAGFGGSASAAAPLCSPTPHSAALAGSTFQSADGDQCDTAGFGITDWQNVTFGLGGLGVAIPDQPATDPFSEFNAPGGAASKEQEPDGWSFAPGSPNGKSDVLNAWIYPEIGAAPAHDLFLNFAFEAADKPGTVSYNIELNKAKQTFLNARGYNVPKRADGDLLITFDSSGSGGATIQKCTWQGTDPTHPWLAGTWTNCQTLAAPIAQGSTNNGAGKSDFPITNYLPGGDAGGDGVLQPSQFAEGTVNLTKALQIGGPNQPPCVSFGDFWVRTRTSTSLSANPEDLILPVPVSVSNCGKVIIKKQTAAPDPTPKFDFISANFGTEVVGAPDTTPAAFQLGNGDTETLDPVKPGTTYTVSESDPVGKSYHLSNLVCNEAGGTNANQTTVDVATRTASIKVDPNETVTCTFTNTRDTGTIKVVKSLSPTGDPGRFDLQVDGATKKADAADGGTTGPITVNTGTHTVGEVAGTKGVLTDYQKSITCKDAAGKTVAAVAADSSGPLDVPVGYQDAITCTITNVRETGAITVVKSLSPASDPGRFDLQVDGTTKKADAANGDTTGAVTVNTGTHTVGEVAGSTGALSDYQKSISCKDAQDKVVASAGADNAGPLDVPVGYQDAITCTITNVRNATLIVHKTTVPAETGADATRFGFTTTIPDGEGSVAFTLAHGETFTTPALAGGDYSVTEQNPIAKGYKLTKLACTQTVPDQTAPALRPRLVAVDGTYAFHADPGDVIDCTYTNTKIANAIHVVKTGPAFAYSGDTLTFGFAVANPGNEPLTDVTVSDDKCPNVQLATKNGDSTPDTLDPGETWNYTCSYVITHHQGDPNPVTNTVTATGTTPDAGKVSDTDTHDTRVLHPAIAIDKTGPATAEAGSLVGYTLAVTNPGDVPFAAPLVVVTDALCQAPPALQSQNGDGSPGTLDPGDRWTYTCQVQTTTTQTQVHNVADVHGTDEHGRGVDATDDATTTLPAQAVSPVTVVSPGSAKLRGPVGCPTTRLVKATVTGRRIVRVTWYVDGRKVATQTRPDRNGRWVRSLRLKSLRYGTHTVVAKVQFAANSGTKAKTMRLSFTRCRPAVVTPKFTG